MSLVFELAVIVFLVVLNGAFAMSEMAIVSSRRARLAALAAQGKRGARAALLLADNPSRFLSSVQIGITLVGILSGAYSGATLSEQFAAWIAATSPWLAPLAEALAMAVVVGAITYASLIIGELVPKQIALSNPEAIAVKVARPMLLAARLAAPLVWVLEHSSRLVLGLCGVVRKDGGVTHDDVKAVIAEGAQSGALHPREKDLLAGVMRFGERKIKAVMTPRQRIEWLDLTWDDDALHAALRRSRRSRLLVCRDGLDDVLGVVRTQDVLALLLDGGPLALDGMAQPLTVVPDNSPAIRVLDQLLRAPEQMALVVDEYGCVEGIVTPTDILAVLSGAGGAMLGAGGVGIQADGENVWLVDGDAGIDVAAELLDCPLLRSGQGDYVTMGGFILARSRAIPQIGDRFEWDGWRFEVAAMSGRRIVRLKVSRLADLPALDGLPA